MLKIKLLGKLQFIYDGKEVGEKIGQKGKALISMLLLSPEKQMPRDRLMFFLWPDSREEAARYNLRYNFWLIKKTIGSDQGGETLLNIDKEFCSINNKYTYECDVNVVREVCPEKETDIGELSYWHSLFTGDFMDGSYFSDCEELNEKILMERINLENRKSRILKRMALLYQEMGKLRSCLEMAEEALLVDPYDEEMALLLMKTYGEMGMQGKSIKFFLNFKEKMIVELGVRPNSEIQQTYKGMLENKEEEAPLEEVALLVDYTGSEKIPYYCLSMITGKILSKAWAKQMDEEKLMDLFTIQRDVGAYINTEKCLCRHVETICIINSFIDGLAIFGRGREIKIVLKGRGSIDEFSQYAFYRCSERKIAQVIWEKKDE